MPICLTVISAVISAGVILYAGGSTAQLSFFTFLPLVVLVVSTFAFYYITAPVAFLTETERVVSTAIIEKTKLEALQQPKLEILFENGKEPYEQRAVADGHEGRGNAIVRVAVKNTSNVFLSGCKVILEEMEDSPLKHLLPVVLKQRHDNPSTIDSGAVNHKQTFDLAPQQREFFDVAQMSEASTNPTIRLCYARQNGHPRHGNIAQGTYRLKIKAFAKEGGPAEASFELNTDNGFLRLSLLKTSTD